MKAIWRVNDAWFDLKRDAVKFATEFGISEDKIIRVPISPYLNPRDLVAFINKNFAVGVLK